MITLSPGKTIGILGGGQLGRMTALAAAALGYKTHIYCADDTEPALQVTPLRSIAAYDDKAALRRFAAAVDVVTFEWENLPIEALETIEATGQLVCPAAQVLKIAQDRILEKNFARSHGLGTAEFSAVNDVADLKAAIEKIGYPAMLKTTRMGYDGKGQVRLLPGSDLQQAWQDIGGVPAILEAFVDFSCEVSVIVARRADGLTATYPPMRNVHRDQILAESHYPSGLPDNIAREAQTMATILADKLQVVGLLAVEMFVLKTPNAAGQNVLMNEIAPRPHNSGHWTMDACACSQFEQLVRAICGLPLGVTAAHSHAVMYNLLGAAADQWQEWLGKPNACLHLYGKPEARAGRKMGHVTVLTEEA